MLTFPGFFFKEANLCYLLFMLLHVFKSLFHFCAWQSRVLTIQRKDGLENIASNHHFSILHNVFYPIKDKYCHSSHV